MRARSTSTNEFRTIFNDYIMDSVADEYNENVGVDAQNMAEIYGYIKERFASEYDHLIKRVGVHSAMVEWLQGLAINIDYMNYRIIELAKSWGTLSGCASEREEDRIVTNYWDFMATKIVMFAKKEGVIF